MIPGAVFYIIQGYLGVRKTGTVTAEPQALLAPGMGGSRCASLFQTWVCGR